MSRLLRSAALIPLLLAAPAWPARIEGVEFPARREWGGTELRLNGVPESRDNCFFLDLARQKTTAPGGRTERTAAMSLEARLITSPMRCSW